MDANLRERILTALQQRNKRQRHYFHDLIAAQNRLFESVNALKAENLHLTIQNEKLRIENAESNCGSKDKHNGKANEKTMALEMKLFRLQEELTELHRRKGENAQQLIDLRNTLQDKEKEMSAKDIKLKDYEITINAMLELQRNLEQKIKEIEDANQILKDEHQALQLAFMALQEQYRAVKDDNRELLERWMAQKALDADKMNEENESAFKQTLMKRQKELSDAADDPVVVDIPEKHSPVDHLTFKLPNYVVKKFDAHDGEVQAVKWGPKGRLFASGGADRKVRLWELIKDNVERRGILTGSNAAITSVDFDSEEHLILGTSNDFASRVWTVSDLRLRHTLTGHSGRVLAAKFLGDSMKVVSGSHDRTLKIWDLRSLACVRTIFSGSSCNDVVTDSTGTMIISGHFDKRIRFWDTRRESTANEVLLQGKVTSLDISPDGCHLLTCVRDNTLKLLDLKMNQVIGTFHAEGFWVAFDWTRATFTPDGQYVAAGSQDGTIFIWSVADSTLVKTLKEHTHAVAACSWQCNGSTLVSCDRNKQVVVWKAN